MKVLAKRRVVFASIERIAGGGERFLLDLHQAASTSGRDSLMRSRQRSWLSAQTPGRRIGMWKPAFLAILVLNDFRSVWTSVLRDRLCHRVFVVHGAWQLSRSRALILRMCRVRVWVVSEELRGDAESLGLAARVVDLWPIFSAASPQFRKRAIVSPRAVCVARLDSIKRVDQFAEITRTLGWPATLVCPAPRSGAEEAMLRDAVEKNPRMVVSHEAPTDAYAEADVLLSLSKRESLGITILEALAYGIPALTTASGGPRELLTGPLAAGLIDLADCQTPADAAESVRDAYLRCFLDVENYWLAAEGLLQGRRPSVAFERIASW